MSRADRPEGPRCLVLDVGVGDQVRVVAGGNEMLMVVDRRKGSRVKLRFIAAQSTVIRKLSSPLPAAITADVAP